MSGNQEVKMNRDKAKRQVKTLLNHALLLIIVM